MGFHQKFISELNMVILACELLKLNCRDLRRVSYDVIDQLQRLQDARTVVDDTMASVRTE